MKKRKTTKNKAKTKQDKKVSGVASTITIIKNNYYKIMIRGI